MATAGRASGFMENAYRLLMRRTSVYVTFVLSGAIVGERVVDYGINKIWDVNNAGKRYEDIPTLGSKVAEEEEGSNGAEEQGSNGAEEQVSNGAEEQGSNGAEEQGSKGAEEEE